MTAMKLRHSCHAYESPALNVTLDSHLDFKFLRLKHCKNFVSFEVELYMPRQPRGDFSEATKRVISGNYNNRCAICLQKPTKRGRQCAHLFDNAGTGALQVSIGAYRRVQVLAPSCFGAKGVFRFR